MMHLLKSIAYDVAVCMSQLFEYYFYSVFVFFASENVISNSWYNLIYFRHMIINLVYIFCREMFQLKLYQMLSLELL